MVARAGCRLNPMLWRCSVRVESAATLRAQSRHVRALDVSATMVSQAPRLYEQMCGMFDFRQSDK
jgi:hypothetical protein